MARARNIKPGFFVNEDLVEMDFGTRLLFIGLWTIADRRGRLQDRPKKIKMSVFPADSVDVDPMLQDLADAGLVQRYEVGENKYIQILNFEKHQNPHKNEAESSIPAPDEQGASTVQAPDRHGGNHADSHDSHDSGLSTSPPLRSGEGSPAKPEARPNEFDEFKSKYPKRAGSQPWPRAHKAIQARLREGHTWEEILSGVERYTAFCQATNKIGTETVMQAATFCGPDKRFLEPFDLPKPEQTHGETSKRDRPQSAVQRSREGARRYFEQQGYAGQLE